MYKDESLQYIPASKIEPLKKIDAIDSTFETGFDFAFDLKEARKKFGSYIEKRFSKKQDCPFLKQNMESSEDIGLFIYIAAKEYVEKPIEIALKSGAKYQKVMIFAGRDSRAQFIFKASKDRNFCHTWIDVTVDRAANVESILIDDRDSEGSHFFHIDASVMQEARFEQKIFSAGGYLKRYRFDASIEGEMGHAEIKEFAMGKSSSDTHLYSKIHHKAPHTTSYQLSKHLLFEEARASFTGKIHIDSIAQLSNAYQLSKSLLLSPKAISHVKPGLEIFADDVKASHGATISSIDSELLFYLSSRGLDERSAKKLLTLSFARDLLDGLDATSSKEWKEKI